MVEGHVTARSCEFNSHLAYRVRPTRQGIPKGRQMKKFLALAIAVLALSAAGVYFTVRELGNVLDEDSLDLFAEEPDFE